MAIDEMRAAPLEVLRHVSLFSGWPDEGLRQLSAHLHLLTVPPGAVLCEEGEPGEEMYIVEDGRFTVETQIGETLTRLAELGPGAVLGEMAVLSGQPRSATVRTETGGRLWALARADFQQTLRSYPELGLAVARLMADRENAIERLRPSNEKSTLSALGGEKDVVAIGRDTSNDIVLAEPQVSRVHAIIQRIGSRYQVVDLNSAAGTYVNGEQVERRWLKEGDRIWIGTQSIIFDRSALIGYSHGPGIKVDANDLRKIVGRDQTILDNVSLSIYPGEFVCIVGGSGAGKTTLLNALNGFVPASSGNVRYNSIDYYQHYAMYRPSLGYVPQDDIVHAELTVHQTLYYAARLRLPRDTRPSEIEERIAAVLDNLELTAVSTQQVRKLSGGQRKRVSIGVELLTEPGIFYLDEPTSGLDPGLENRMMGLLRKLASQGRTVIMTTHATRSVMMCDKIAFMARGGELVFFGAPADALTYFGVEDFAEIYTLLEEGDEPGTWRDRFQQSDYYRRNIGQRLAQPAATEQQEKTDEQRSKLHLPNVAASTWQFAWLTARHLSILRRDPLLLILLLVQAPVIGVALVLTFSHHVFAISAQGGGDAREAISLLFTMAVSSVYLGADGASRTITEERAVYARERLINLRIFPYVLSKVAILGLFSIVQSVLLMGIVTGAISVPGGSNSLLTIFLVVTLTNVVGVGMGLLVSSVSTNSLQAGATVILLIIPQLILAGAYVPLSRVSGVGNAVATLFVSRWSLSLLGHFTDMNMRLNAQLVPGTTNAYAGQFAINAPLYVLVLAGFFIAFITGTLIMLKRRDLG